MNVLIVEGHPEPSSFSGALTALAVSTLDESGHAVQVSDLYAMGFKATAGVDDFTGPREDPSYFRLDREQTFAHRSGTTASDIVAEQVKVAWADLLILQYPMWWFGMPAILKGWVDRVFTRGFAYLPGHKYDTGLMRGKLAMVSVTTGTSAETYAPDGIDGALIDILWPVHNGILRYSGFDVLTPFVSHMPGRLSAEEKEAVFAQWRERLLGVESAERLFFHPSTDYGVDQRLLPEVTPRSGFQHRPAPGPGGRG